MLVTKEELTEAIKGIRFNPSESSIRKLVLLCRAASLTEGMELTGAVIDEAIRDALPKTGESTVEREFPHMRPRCWVHKDKKTAEKKGYFKVVPWFQPLDNESRIDFKGLMKDLAPEIFTNDVMADVEFYSGLVSFCGYQLYNDGGMWICMQPSAKQFFEDLGEWDEAKHGANTVPTFPVTEEGEAHKKAAEARRKKRGRNKR